MFQVRFKDEMQQTTSDLRITIRYFMMTVHTTKQKSYLTVFRVSKWYVGNSIYGRSCWPLL